MPKVPRDPLPRFMQKVAKQPGPDGCWLWTGALSHNGYGFFKMHPKMVKTHRFAYERFIGPIPDGMLVCHHCDVPRCVNPAHLFVGTHADNHSDREIKGRGRRLHGETNPRSKITAADVYVIRAACGAGTSQQAVADQFGITQGMVSRIMRGVAWKHVA